MSDRPRIGLDNAVFAGRLRQSVRRVAPPSGRPVATFPTSELRQRQVAQRLQPSRRIEVEQPPQPTVPPPVVDTPEVDVPPVRQAPPSARKKTLSRAFRAYSTTQKALVGMACVVFVIGLAVSLQTMKTNRQAGATVAQALADDSDPSGDNPSTDKPSITAFREYTVAPDLARYIKIPKLGVNARVMQVGTKANGELWAPNNVHDAAWYTGSAKPGKAGAALIDGHVSSWSVQGVFYNLKKLTAGDNIQIVRGDGLVFTYRVVKSQTYEAESVDMKAAMTPITPGTPGLNLISCTGKVKPGTNDFTHRVVVFAEQI